MRIDNNTLAVVLVVAIVLSVGVLFYNSGFLGISGAATTAQGLANFTINTSVSIRFIDNYATLGEGAVNTSTMAMIDSEGNRSNWTGVPTHNFMTLENDGNTVANITLVANNAPASWIGGSSGTPNFFVRPNFTEINSCLTWGTAGAGNMPHNNYTALSTTNLVACQRLNYTDSADTIEFNFRMHIPSDAIPGSKQVTLTATGATASAF